MGLDLAVVAVDQRVFDGASPEVIAQVAASGAAREMARIAARKAQDVGMKTVAIFVKGPGAGRESALLQRGRCQRALP